MLKTPKTSGGTSAAYTFYSTLASLSNSGASAGTQNTGKAPAITREDKRLLVIYIDRSFAIAKPAPYLLRKALANAIEGLELISIPDITPTATG